MGQAAAAHFMPSGHMPSKADPDMKQGFWVQTKCMAAQLRKAARHVMRNRQQFAYVSRSGTTHSTLAVYCQNENQTNRECKLLRVATTAVPDGFERLEPCMQNL